MSLDVLKPGLATTVQDLGRPGHYDVGIPLSGAMDRFALRAANMLVGNDEGAAALEIVFMGPALRFAADALVAVTGAELPPKLDGEARPTWTSFSVAAGQVLSFDYLRRGARAYLAVAGGIDVPLVLGSRSTYVLGALGGHEGRALRAGDVLPLGAAAAGAAPGRCVPEALRRGAAPAAELRVVPGLYHHRVAPDSLERFFGDAWAVAPEADRIGYRFRGGRPLAFVDRRPPFGAGSDSSNIVDSCYPYGSIQVPGGNEPIVLHRDAVSGGGYFMLGTVISADMDAIGQMQPHAKVRFVPVTMQQALEARRERRDALAAVRRAVDGGGPSPRRRAAPHIGSDARRASTWPSRSTATWAKPSGSTAAATTRASCRSSTSLTSPAASTPPTPWSSAGRFASRRGTACGSAPTRPTRTCRDSGGGR